MYYKAGILAILLEKNPPRQWGSINIDRILILCYDKALFFQNQIKPDSTESTTERDKMVSLKQQVNDVLQALRSGKDVNDLPHRNDLLYGKVPDPGHWTRICGQASNEVYGLTDIDSKVIRASLDLEWLNGYRRTKNPYGEIITHNLGLIQSQIDDLPVDNSSRPRLQLLLDFHRGVVAGQLGDFPTAAKFHRQSAEAAESKFHQAVDALGLNIDRWIDVCEQGLSADMINEESKKIFKDGRKAMLQGAIEEYLASREVLNDSLANGVVPLGCAFREYQESVGILWNLCQKPVDDKEEADELLRWALNCWHDWQIKWTLIQSIIPGDHSLIVEPLDLPSEMMVPENLHGGFEGSHYALLALRALSYDAEAAIIAAGHITPADPEFYSMGLLIQAHALRLLDRHQEAFAVAGQLMHLSWACHLAQGIARQLGYIE